MVYCTVLPEMDSEGGNPGPFGYLISNTHTTSVSFTWQLEPAPRGRPRLKGTQFKPLADRSVEQIFQID